MAFSFKLFAPLIIASALLLAGCVALDENKDKAAKTLTKTLPVPAAALKECKEDMECFKKSVKSSCGPASVAYSSEYIRIQADSKPAGEKCELTIRVKDIKAPEGSNEDFKKQLEQARPLLALATMACTIKKTEADLLDDPEFILRESTLAKCEGFLKTAIEQNRHLLPAKKSGEPVKPEIINEEIPEETEITEERTSGSCSLPNSESTCTICSITRCHEGFYDLDGISSNGCESNTGPTPTPAPVAAQPVDYTQVSVINMSISGDSPYFEYHHGSKTLFLTYTINQGGFKYIEVYNMSAKPPARASASTSIPAFVDDISVNNDYAFFTSIFGLGVLKFHTVNASLHQPSGPGSSLTRDNRINLGFEKVAAWGSSAFVSWRDGLARYEMINGTARLAAEFNFTSEWPGANRRIIMYGKIVAKDGHAIVILNNQSSTNNSDSKRFLAAYSPALRPVGMLDLGLNSSEYVSGINVIGQTAYITTGSYAGGWRIHAVNITDAARMSITLTTTVPPVEGLRSPVVTETTIDDGKLYAMISATSNNGTVDGIAIADLGATPNMAPNNFRFHPLPQSMQGRMGRTNNNLIVDSQATAYQGGVLAVMGLDPSANQYSQSRLYILDLAQFQ